MRLLCFRLAKAAYAVALEDVADVAPAAALRRVPGAPAAVRGLAERHGRVVAVLDGPALLEDEPREGGPTFHIRLGAPHEDTVLWIPSRVVTADGVPAAGETVPRPASTSVLVDDEPHLLLDVDALLRAASR